MIGGRVESRVRHYLKTRMPVYPAPVAEQLAAWFEKMDRPEPLMREIAVVDDLEAGRRLLGTHSGVGCVSCHQWGDLASLGIRGMDLRVQHRRLQAGWFRSFLLEPARYRPATLMPPLWPGGKSSVPDVLGGDTEQQIGAIWAFLRDGADRPDGFPESAGGRFELVPENRPIIQRTFMEGVGTQAILVGFPGGINLAYDAEKAEPRLVWRGRFFDAYNTWFSRFAPLEKPLEAEVKRFGEGPERRRFLGYEIDAAGNPTFLSASAGTRIEEFFAVDAGVLVRKTTVEGDGVFAFEDPVGLDAASEPGESPGIIITNYSWK